jgi:hypothetical protein
MSRNSTRGGLEQFFAAFKDLTYCQFDRGTHMFAGERVA